MLSDLATSIGAFAAYFGVALALTVTFVFIYMQTTPHKEFALIRDGNGAAALGLAGAVLGFVLPLALVISVSHAISEALIWGAIALIVQVAGHWLARLLFPKLNADIAAGKYAAAIVQAAFAIVLGLLQAACWTP
ncbi:DUF350 domain-containing protein [Terricaulis sp.]|uniref:DUF350 domain-containing protein n=1 Tax=Terricaulis sp. TaxID=2768686 RepID=UPI0037832C0E